MSLDSVFIHPKALVESTDIGAGTRVWAFAQVMKGAKIGADCNICGFSFVESGATLGNGVTLKNGIHVWDKVTIEDNVFVGPSVVFTNELLPRAFRKSTREQWQPTLIRKGATLGAGSVIVCGHEIGEYAFIAAGTVVCSNVAPYTMMRGNPGRMVGWVCRCLKTRLNLDQRGKSLSCKECETEISPLKV